MNKLTNKMNRLPIELKRYIYGYIYPDVKTHYFIHKYGLYNIIQQFIDSHPYLYADVIYKSIEKYFPNYTQELYKYFILEYEKIGGRKIYWHEPTEDIDNVEYKNSLINELIEIINSKPLPYSYGLISSYMIMYNDSLHTEYDSFDDEY